MMALLDREFFSEDDEDDEESRQETGWTPTLNRTKSSLDLSDIEDFKFANNSKTIEETGWLGNHHHYMIV